MCGRDADEREKIRSDLSIKLQCVLELIGHRRLARETLANKWRGLSDKMLVSHMQARQQVKGIKNGA